MRSFILGFIGVSAFASATAVSAADYAPLDCRKANAPALSAICNNYSLGQAEARMATLFGIATSLVPWVSAATSSTRNAIGSWNATDAATIQAA